MKITRQRPEIIITQWEDGEIIETINWIEFEDDMTKEEEIEFYQREVDEITSELPNLRSQRDWIQELIEYELNAESDIKTLEAIQSQMLSLATRRKELIEIIQNLQKEEEIEIIEESDTILKDKNKK
jgi:hypothetical protein